MVVLSITEIIQYVFFLYLLGFCSIYCFNVYRIETFTVVETMPGGLGKLYIS